MRTIRPGLLLLFLGGAILASPASSQELDPRVEIVIQDGEPGRWRAPTSPEEIAARQTMEGLLRRPELGRHVSDALRRMERYHGNTAPGAMPLNTEGRLRIVLDMNMPASSGGAAVAFREGPGGALETYVMKGGRDLGMVRPETTPTMYRKTHEYMVHEFDHVGLVFAEFDHSARTGNPIQERMIFQPDNVGHSFLTPSDTRGTWEVAWRWPSSCITFRRRPSCAGRSSRVTPRARCGRPIVTATVPPRVAGSCSAFPF